MKITFQAETFHELLRQMQDVLAGEELAKQLAAPEKISAGVPKAAKPSTLPPAQGPGPDLFDEPKAAVDKPVDKPAKTVNPQIAKMQAAKAAKKAEREAAAAAAAPPVEEPAPPPKKAKAVPLTEPVDPADMVKIRQKTIADLQDAYANGHQAEVFELLSRFGNGAKSFRELPPDAFVPISEAIAKGALT